MELFGRRQLLVHAARLALFRCELHVATEVGRTVLAFRLGLVLHGDLKITPVLVSISQNGIIAHVI